MTLHPRTLAALDAALYLFVTLGFALIWHVHAFDALYTSLNWPRPDPSDIALGFVAVMVQGITLGVLFQHWIDGSALIRSAATFSGVAFVFLWTSHVIGDAAKCGFLPLRTFVAVETAYLAIQFAIYCAILVLIHRSFDARVTS